MDLARDVCSAVLTLRETNRLRTRLPLRHLIIAHPDATTLSGIEPIIAEFVNVKSVELEPSIESYGTRTLKVNPRIGASIGSKMKEVMAAQRRNDWTLLADGRVAISGLRLEPNDFELRVAVRDGVFAESFDRWRGLAVLDRTITPELRDEGWARDFIRLVQSARKNARFEITDRIALVASVPQELRSAVERHIDAVRAETLTVDLVFAADPSGERVEQDEFDGMQAHVGLRRVPRG
jgi:isoleucyl-tRNA synthetase